MAHDNQRHHAGNHRRRKRVHTALGPGLLESTYRACLCRELDLSGRRYLTEVPVPITYRGLTIPTANRMDILVEDVVIVEINCCVSSDGNV